MRLLAPVHTQALARIAGILNLPEARSGDDLDAARAAAGAVAALVSRLGLPNRLGSFGLDRPALVKAVESVGATPEQAEYLVARCSEGKSGLRIGSLKHFSRRAAGPASPRAPGRPARRGGAAAARQSAGAHGLDRQRCWGGSAWGAPSLRWPG